MKAKITIALLVGIIIGGATFWYTSGNDPENSNQPTSKSQSSGDSSPETSSPVSSGKTLDYSNKGLSSFPKEILSQTDVVVLNLSGNNLTGALPAEIRKLTKLEVLDVSDNNMTGIPAEIGQLKRLKLLNYANNQITGLPNELGNLTQLQTFDLSGNNPSQQDLSGIRAKLTNTEFIL